MRLFATMMLLTTAVSGFAQTNPTQIAGVAEPPELTGEPKQVHQASEAERKAYEKLSEIFKHMTNENAAKTSLPALNQFIAEHPAFSDAFFLRAMSQACVLNSNDYERMRTDVETAISRPDRKIYNDTELYSLLSKIELVTGHYRNALEDLEKAMARDYDSADNMFNSGGVEPEKTSKFCSWNLTDLDTLIAKFPQDYRTWVFRGLYFKFFTSFSKNGESIFERPLQDFQKASALNPQSPIPPYYIGLVYNKQSFWTPKAWESDAVRSALIRKMIQPYTTAIQNDPKFRQAYVHRAGAYLDLKQYSKAIKDFDMVVDLDPENKSAINDRGIAKMESGDLWGAVWDFKDSLQHRAPDDSYLPSLYENLGDTYVKMRSYREAIGAYSKAIERRLANDTFLLSLKQIRGLYPEYDSVSDEVLCRKINLLFWPEYAYTVVANRLMKENGNWSIGLLNDLYEKRGDAYLRVNDFRHGALDFQRIFKGIPNFADVTNRWRTIGNGEDKEEYFLDVETAEFPADAAVHFWVKTVGKKENTLSAFEVNCKTRRINQSSSASYDAQGKLQFASEDISGSQPIIPDTVGEHLYNGACSSASAASAKN